MIIEKQGVNVVMGVVRYKLNRTLFNKMIY